MQKGTATVLQICNTPTPSERIAGELGCYLYTSLIRTRHRRCRRRRHRLSTLIHPDEADFLVNNLDGVYAT